MFLEQKEVRLVNTTSRKYAKFGVKIASFLLPVIKTKERFLKRNLNITDINANQIEMKMVSV